MSLRPLASAFAAGLIAATLHLSTFAAPGDLDTSFGSGGKVITPVGSGSAYGESVVVQSDGKIVVAGRSSNGSNLDFTLVRYNTDGTLDSGFGSGGKVVTAVGSGNDYGQSIALQVDGKIVVAGFATNGSDDFALVRYNANGTLDSGFGNGGKVTTAIGSSNDDGYSVVLQSDGKIVVAGVAYKNGSYEDFALVRYNADGTLDSGFGSGGKVTTDFGSSSDYGRSVAVQGDGKIVVAGYRYYGKYDFALVRYNADGTLDSGFGNGGKVITPIGSSGDYGRGVAVQGDGKIVVAGYSTNGGQDFALVRYNPDGTLDSGFGNGGKVTTDIASNNNSGTSMAVQSDGKIVVAGVNYGGTYYDFALVRYNADGTLDSGFNSSGKVTTNFGSIDSFGYSVALQSDGKIVVAGSSYSSSKYAFAVARYEGAPPPPSSATLTLRQVSADRFANSGINAGVDQPLIPQPSVSAMLNQTEVSAGLVADGVTPLLVQVQLAAAPSSSSDYRIRVVSVSGNHTTGEIEQKLRLLNNGVWVPFDSGHNTITISPTDNPPVAFAYLEALAAEFINPAQDGTEVTVQLGVQKADDTEAEALKTFKLRKPPVVLVHGYNTTGVWGSDFLNTLTQDHSADFVKVIQYGVENGVATQNTNYSLAQCAQLLDLQLANEIENPSSLLHSQWAFTRYDAVGHSQGGVLLRMLSSQRPVEMIPPLAGTLPAFRNATNANRGRFHRVVTIGSPHNGSRLLHYTNKLTEDINVFSAIPQLLALKGLLQSKFDPWGGQIRDVNAPAPSGRWIPDPTAKFLLIRTTINNGGSPGLFASMPAYTLLGLNLQGGSTVLPHGADGVVDLDSQGKSDANNVVTLPATSNVAHSQPLALFAPLFGSVDVESIEVAVRVRTALAGDGSNFGAFPVPALLYKSERDAIDAAAARTLLVGDVIELLLLSPREQQMAQAAAPSASTYAFVLNPPPGQPVQGTAVWNLDVFGLNGVTQDGVSFTVDAQDSRKVTVMVGAGVVGDVVLSAHYALANGGLAFARAIKVVSIAPSGVTLSGIELEPGTGTLAVGASMALRLWANYSDGSRLLVFPDPAVVTFNPFAPAIADASPTGIVSLKSVGNATIEVSYGGQTAQAQFVVTPAESVPVVPSNDARLSTLSVAGATLAPAFDAAVTNYTATVGNAVASATIAATTADPTASFVQTPSNPVALSLGENPVEVKVTAEDGTTKITYTVTITREHLASPVNTPFLAQGALAPGHGTNGLPNDAVIASLGVPATDNESDIAYLAKWTSGAKVKGSGLFLNSNTCLGLVGGDVSGIGGAKFKTFSDPVVSGGNVVFIATLTGTPKPPASVVMSNANNGTTPVAIAKAGEVAPGLDGLPPTDGAKFKTFKSVSIDGGSIAIFAQLTGGTGTEKASAASDLGIWIKDGTNPLKLAVREGQEIEHKPIKTLVSFAAGNGSPGQGRGWLAQPYGPAVLALVLFGDKSQAVVSVTAGGGAQVFSQTDTTDVNGSPNLTGASFASYSFPATNDKYTAAFLASMTVGAGDVSKADARGVFLSDGVGTYVPLARVGKPAGATGTDFSLLKDPVLAADDGLAFPATLKATTTVKGLSTATLWWKKPSASTPTLLAQAGESAVPVTDIPGAQWKAFTSLAIASGRGPIFAATLVPKKNVVTAANASGVWACDFTGALRLLFRTGDTSVVAGKTLKSFTLLNATVGSLGVTRSFNDNAEVVWLATFKEDKSTAIIRTVVP